MSLSRLPEYSSQILIGVAAAVVAAVVLAVALYVQIGRTDDLQADLDRLKKDYSELNISRGRLATEKEAVERDRDGLRIRAEKAEREGSDAARLLLAEQQAHEKARNGLAALGREVAAAQAKVDEVEKDRFGLRERAEKAERERNEAQARGAESARLLVAEQQALEKTRSDLAARGSDLAAAQAKISEVEKERDGLRGRAEKAERESSEAQSRQADAARLLQAEQQALERTRGELAAARAEISTRNEEIRRLEGKPESAAHERQ